MNQWVCRQVVLPQVAKAHHRNDTNTPRNATESHPHPTNPRKSSGVTIVGPTTAIATHTTSQSRCVPFSDPHVHKVARSTDTRQECTNSSAKAMGTSPPSGEDTPCRREVQRKEKGGGTSAKSSVLRLTCVPLPHLVLPLSGCACSGTPTMATRGEARGHP